MERISRIVCAAFILAFTAVIVEAQINWTMHVVSNYFETAHTAEAVDLDEDGDMDIVGSSYSTTLCWWENDGAQNFTQNIIDATLDHPAYVVVIDFDNDNDLDLVVSNTYDDEIVWFENNGSEVFTRHFVGGNFRWPRGLAAIDLDRDGDTDVICASDQPDAIRWWQNSGNNLNFTEISIKENWAGAWGVWAGDLDGDQDIDILGTAITVHQIIWFENNGSQVFTEHIIDPAFSRAWTVEVCDLDQDSDLDIIGGGDPGFNWYENNGSQVFSQHSIVTGFTYGRSVKVGDIDHDGDLDLAGSAWSADMVAWFENNGSQTFTQHTIQSNLDGANYVSLADIDGDQNLDIAGAIMRDNLILWWENDLPTSMSIILTPANPPIQIPGGGGMFNYSAEVENFTNNPLNFDAWTEAILPNGAVYGPLLLRTGLNIPGGVSLQRQLNQFVPPVAPPGNYQYVGKVGVYPDSVTSSDSFPFSKFIGDGITNHNMGWEVFGWEDEESQITNHKSQITNLAASPNPFNAQTRLTINLPESGEALFAVFDISGREVANLMTGYYPAGPHQVVFDASGLSSGVYFACLKAGSLSSTQKLLLIK